MTLFSVKLIKVCLNYYLNTKKVFSEFDQVSGEIFSLNLLKSFIYSIDCVIDSENVFDVTKMS